MNELTLDGKIYVSSKRAAELTGYAKDYVGQLCREGRIDARLVGRNWYVLKDAIRDRRFELLSGQNSSEAAQDTEKSENASKDSYRGIDTAAYEPEKYEVFPSVNRLVDTSTDESAPKEEKGTMDRLNEAWSTWFSGEEKKKQPDIEETIEEKPEKVNLRRIRDYSPVARAQEEPVFESEEKTFEEINNGNTSVRREMPLYALFARALFVGAAVFALAIGYIGSAFYNPNSNLPKPINFIAGAAIYQKAN